MIGDTVSDEVGHFLDRSDQQITRDMMNATYGYPVILNHFALWMIVLTPLTKFGLCTRPVRRFLGGMTDSSYTLLWRDTSTWHLQLRYSRNHHPAVLEPCPSPPR